MITDATIRAQGYAYFLSEAPELLQIIDQELFDLSSNRSVNKVHNLMRATHTLKGGAANVGLDNIKMIAHSLEDVFKTLYNPNVLIDHELQLFLAEAYECLHLAVTAEVTQCSLDSEELLYRATSVFANLQEKLGDAFGVENHIPTSEELGFDIVGSIFEVGVQQRLEDIAKAIQDISEQQELIEYLSSQLEVFLGLADSLNLPGWGELVQTIIAALAANPHQVFKIGEIALADLQRSQKLVLAGDRTNGGSISAELRSLSTQTKESALVNLPKQELSITSGGQSFAGTFFHITGDLYRFLTISGSRNNQPLKSTNAKLYLKVIRYIFGWFNHCMDVPVSELNLSLLIPEKGQAEIIDYVEEWLYKLVNFLEEAEDSPSLRLYRRGVIFIIILAVAKFQYSIKKNADAIGIIRTLRAEIRELGQEYKKLPPVDEQEKNWLEKPKLSALLVVKTIFPSPSWQPDDRLLESIWGEESVTVATVAELQEDDYLSSVTSSVVSEQVLAATIPESIAEVVDQAVPQLVEDPGLPLISLRQPAFVRVNVEGLQKLNYLAGELLIYQKRRNLLDEQITELIEQLNQRLHRHLSTLNELRDLPMYGNDALLPRIQKFPYASFDTLEMDVYTEFNLKLHEAFDETLQLQETTESLDLLSKQADQIGDKKNALTLNIIDNLVEARMLPLGTILNRFPQMVSKLAHVYAKPIELKLIGSHVLVDKAIAERLYDPLLQLVRNAFDHGIELPQVRSELGKPETGLIEIHSYHQGSYTVIEVRDDGYGLNFAGIRQRAIELHLLTDDQLQSYAHQPTEAELIDLMFSPGFSTSGQVSEISGRGMGLDIVRTQLQALNGLISVQSSPGQGTTFILKIPFSMTTDKLMLVQAGVSIYALLLDSIEKIVIPSSEELQEFEGKQVLHWCVDENEYITNILRLSNLIDYSRSLIKQTDSSKIASLTQTQTPTNPILLIRHNQGVLGLEVDSIIGEQELVIRPLGNAITPPKYVYGCSSLANGNLILVIDASLLMDAHQKQASLDIVPLATDYSLRQPREIVSESTIVPTAVSAISTRLLVASASEMSKLAKLVLVVDDAISLRQTLSLTLQKFGYQVVQAQDGVEAIEQLQLHPEIEVVISDLEMPRMNGFELLSHIRQNETTAKKPVVVLTSRSGMKHRQLAVELGANAYLNKPYLEQELISILRNLESV